MNTETSGKPNLSNRRRARRMGLQALYQWHMNQDDISEIETQFFVDNDIEKFDVQYFRDILHGVPAKVSEIDGYLKPLLDRDIKDLTPVELSILRMSVFELQTRIDVPYRVVINEAIELAKNFGATDGHKFVNGILDKLAPRFRHEEVLAARQKP